VNVSLILTVLVGMAIGRTLDHLEDAWRNNSPVGVFFSAILTVFFVVAGVWLIGGGAK
jgi:hypothetical protein